jgi:hypothetical protein
MIEIKNEKHEICAHIKTLFQKNLAAEMLIDEYTKEPIPYGTIVEVVHWCIFNEYKQINDKLNEPDLGMDIWTVEERLDKIVRFDEWFNSKMKAYDVLQRRRR